MDEKKNIIILGGGLSGISTAYFLSKKGWSGNITILEKESTTGGLCRSIKKGGYIYDIGPHILFSKDKEILDLMLSVLDGKNDLKRSNEIFYKGCHIQYPFENDLSKLPKEELDYCIQTFNHNPYENYVATNMIQFFLKTFGEGITNTYLRPYNEKIWKYDPAFMNTAMVERIPKPTQDDIRRSAAGETVEGYLHQLYFSFPKDGGIQAVVDGFKKRLDEEKCKVITDSAVKHIEKTDTGFTVTTVDETSYSADLVISTIPVQELSSAYSTPDDSVKKCVDALRYNSIAIAFVRTPYDLCGEHFTFTIPDKSIIFHRISKMDFLGSAYHKNGEATYIVEVTYRKGDSIDSMPEAQFIEKICRGLCEIGFAKLPADVTVIDITKYQYAYVIYDLDHAENMKTVREFYRKQGIILNGRFGNFEYWNMDRILRESFTLVNKLMEDKK